MVMTPFSQEAQAITTYLVVINVILLALPIFAGRLGEMIKDLKSTLLIVIFLWLVNRNIPKLADNQPAALLPYLQGVLMVMLFSSIVECLVYLLKPYVYKKDDGGDDGDDEEEPLLPPYSGKEIDSPESGSGPDYGSDPDEDPTLQPLGPSEDESY